MAKSIAPRPHRKCSCGSKKKYRNCCGIKTQTIPFHEFPKETPDMFRELKIKYNLAEKYHNQYFGGSSAINSCIFNGVRNVSVGGKILVCDNPKTDWESPSDFLVSYLKTSLGNKWFDEEIQKPESEQHEIIKWYFDGNPNIDEKNSLKWHKPNGKALALLHLAYDLFVLDNIGNLPDRLINRIKNNGNFNGARYEAFVFATLIRAGFKIEYQDETSGQKGRVTECRALLPKSDEYISVEAKTRNVRGILGASKGSKSKIRLYDKLKDAVNKNVNDPYVVFVDANFPELNIIENKEKVQKIRGEFKKLEENYPDLLPNLICITNIPFHYGKNDELPNKSAFGFMIIHQPKIQLKNKNNIINAIMSSIDNYAYLPNEFNQAENFADSVLNKK